MNRKTPLARKKPLTRSSALARKTPMSKATTELRRRVAVKKRNHARRPPAAAIAQREAVMERDVTCAFEVQTSCGWMRCGAMDFLQTCHVVRRHLCGDAWADPDVAIAGCEVCHNIADHRSHPDTWDSVRFPESALERAMTAIRRAEASRAARGLAVVAIPSPAERT